MLHARSALRATGPCWRSARRLFPMRKANNHRRLSH